MALEVEGGGAPFGSSLQCRLPLIASVAEDGLLPGEADVRCSRHFGEIFERWSVCSLQSLQI